MISNSQIYVKRGNLNYKERKLIEAIKASLEKKNTNMTNFIAAKNYEQLEKLAKEYALEDVAFVEVEEKNTNSQKTDTQETVSAAKKETESVDNADGYSPDIDPLNREAPIVRDYVMDEGMKRNDSVENTKTTFEEPINFSESFEMPNSDNNDDDSSSSNNKSSSRNELKEEKTEKPFNPQFDDMSEARKRKNTKKFAKTIVKAVCKLAEMGCQWWVTKDITEDKLVQYELNNEIDLAILLSLEENQTITVKNWFLGQVQLSKEVFKISEEEEKDLVESLYEVMLEKGIAPTPMQELMINAVTTIVIGMGVKAFAMSQQINSVLTQLKGMKIEESEQRRQAMIEEEEEHVDLSHAENNPATKDTENEEISTALAKQ